MVAKNPTRGQTATQTKAPARPGAKPRFTQVKGDTETPKVTAPKPATRTEAKATTPKPEKKIEFKKCGCGCGKNIGPKSNYAMGHDARHASAVANEAVRAMLDNLDAEAVIAVLPTDALRHKARNIADNRHAKVVAKMEREASKADKANKDESESN